MADTPTKVSDAWAARRKARGAGVYPESAGGYSASILRPDKTIQELGTFKTHEEAKAAYRNASAQLYPIAPTPQGNGHVTMAAKPLTVKQASPPPTVKVVK